MRTINKQLDIQCYHPFGMMMPGRNSNSGKYRYSINSQEKVDEINGSGNHNTAQFWEYDTRLGRRWNLDPKPVFGISDYAALRNNPIKFTDVNGDSSVFDSKGSKIWYDKNDKDLRVFMKDGEKLTQIGELGKDVNVNRILNNVLEENKDAAYNMNPIGWYNNVKKDGEWDYKNNESTIFGIAWNYDEESKAKDINAENTNFIYKDFGINGEFNAADIGNYNAGWTGTLVGIPDYIQKVGAGTVDQLKNGNHLIFYPSVFYSVILKNIYYGDKRNDYLFNIKGMKDAHENMQKDPKVLH